MGDALDGLMRAWNKPSRPQQSDDWLHPPPTQHTAGVVSLGGGTAGSTGHCLGRPGGDGGRSSWCGHGGSCAFPGVAHGGAGLVPGSYDSGGAPELGRRGVSSAACSGPSSGPGSGLGSGPSGSGLRGNLGRGASGGIGSNVSGSLHSGAGGNLGFAGRGGGGGVVDTRSSGLVGCAGSLPGGGLRAYDGPTSARSHASESVALRLPMGRLADRGGQDAAAHAGTAAAAASCRPTDPHAIALASPAMAPSDKIAAAGPPEHGFAGDQNARHRKYMEDDHVAVGGFAGHSPDLFCALYDGDEPIRRPSAHRVAARDATPMRARRRPTSPNQDRSLARLACSRQATAVGRRSTSSSNTFTRWRSAACVADQARWPRPFATPS